MPLITPFPRRRIGRPKWRGYNALHIARKLGLAGGLQVCLDPGDIVSYPGSGQTWADLSGNGHDFFLGADGSATATDPTFNGTAGRLSSAEYWSFDGGDYFRKTSANSAFINSLHKDNALFTAISLQYGVGSSVFHPMFGTLGLTGAANTGVLLRAASSTGTLAFVVSNGIADTTFISGNLGFAADAWHLVTLIVDEAAGEGWFGVNNTFESFVATYVSPSSGDASFTMEVAARGNGVAPYISGGRYGPLWMWDQALDLTAVRALRRMIGPRFGI